LAHLFTSDIRKEEHIPKTAVAGPGYAFSNPPFPRHLQNAPPLIPEKWGVVVIAEVKAIVPRTLGKWGVGHYFENSKGSEIRQALRG